MCASVAVGVNRGCHSTERVRHSEFVPAATKRRVLCTHASGEGGVRRRRAGSLQVVGDRRQRHVAMSPCARCTARGRAAERGRARPRAWPCRRPGRCRWWATGDSDMSPCRHALGARHAGELPSEAERGRGRGRADGPSLSADAAGGGPRRRGWSGMCRTHAARGYRHRAAARNRHVGARSRRRRGGTVRASSLARRRRAR